MEAPQASLPHTPPRGGRPLDPCFAQLLNCPVQVVITLLTPLILCYAVGQRDGAVPIHIP